MTTKDDEKREREREYARRDDRARLEELEDELAVAQKLIDKYDGRLRTPRFGIGRRALKRAAYDPSSAQKWLGAPALLRLSRRFDGKLPRERFAQVIERVREITHDPGVVEVSESAVVWATSLERHPSQAHLMIRVIVTDGEHPHTQLAVTDRLGALVGRLFGAFGTIVGAGGLAAPVAASLAFPVFAPVFVLGWLGGVYGTTRVLYRKLVTGRAKQLHEIFGALVLEIEAHVVT